MLASDVNNTQFVGAQEPDSVMRAQFYIRAVKNEFQSKLQNRPIFEDVLFCKFGPAGSTLLEMDIPASENLKQRFHVAFAYYQRTQGGDSREAGTPLSQWTILSPADVENLRGMKFSTVENIAGASDQQLQSVGMGAAGMSGWALRARAQAFLAAATDTAIPQKQAEDIAALQQQVKDLTALLTQKPAEAPAQPDEREELVKQYTEKLGKKPHHKLSVAKLKEALEEKAA